MRTQYLDILDLTRVAAELNDRDVAETWLHVDPHRAHRALLRPSLIVEDTEVYGSMPAKATALAIALVREAPYAGSNVDLAWVAMQQFLQANGYRWKSPPRPADCAYVMQRIEGDDVAESEVCSWLTHRLEPGA